MSITGRCLCGACAYTLDALLAPGGICHCEDCRRVTGSAFGVSFRAERSKLARYGVTRVFRKTADSGAELSRHFCPQCGSPLYTESEAHADAVFIKAGSLDDPDALVIDRQMWMVSRTAWLDNAAAHQIFEKGR
jgi:hypothetical protein